MMTRKTLGFMNVNSEEVLSREEMKGILAGSGGSGLNCRVAFRYENGSFAGYSSCMDCGVASSMYNDGWYDNDSLVYASGYCGSSCGGSSFPNASPCY